MSLIAAWLLSMAYVVLPLIAAQLNCHPSSYAVFVRRFPSGHLLFYTIAVFSLFWAFYYNDFSLQYVAANSNSHLPWFYRLCALWGAHEGSLLLWCWLLSIWTFGLTRRRVSSQWPQQYKQNVVGYLSAVNAGLTGFILLTSNPFLRYLPTHPLQGRDLNPLLQDPGMVAHPPILYSGYVGFVVVFAMAIAALGRDGYEQRWVNWVQPWARFAWGWLTLGIILGSWWAYRELGWGGFWGWDPVENASLLPWLMGTALLHLLLIAKRSKQEHKWCMLVALGCFALSLLGTFLVRSGVIISVHAFAQDAHRGLGLLLLLAGTVGFSLFKFSLHGSRLLELGGGQRTKRDRLMKAQLGLFLLATLTILLGTLYPMFVQIIWHENLSVGAPYFNEMMRPQVMFALALMGMVMLCSDQHRGRFSIRRILFFSLILTFALGWLLWFLLPISFNHFSLFMMVLLLWVVSTHAVAILRSYYDGRVGVAMLIAHFGLLVFLVGVMVCSQFSVERHVKMYVGDRLTIGKKTLEFRQVDSLHGPNYNGVRATMALTGDSGQNTILIFPEQRMYQPRGMMLPKVAIQHYFWGDFYVALGREMKDHGWAVRVYTRPMVRLIWGGGLMMVLAVWYAMLATAFRTRLFIGRRRETE